MDTRKILLSEKDIPQEWYNIIPDLPRPLDPPLHPETYQPITPDQLAAIFPMELIRQEVSQERWIPIPDDVRRIYQVWRPTPLIRATALEKALKTPARIYYKNEGVSPPGSHKPNTAVPQAYYNKQEGISRLATETGAGQWGSALAFAACMFGLKCTVYMVKVSYQQKPYRKSFMQSFGAEVFASPTDLTDSGRAILAEDPDCPGSLGIAISEAVEDAVKHDDTRYSLGSVLNHVLLHQTVVGLETEKQLALVDEKPDILIGCVGGGSNFAGFAYPFMKRKMRGNDLRVIAVEPTACPTLTRGRYAYDYGDTAHLTPVLKQYTLGHTFVPPGIHAGGLRYHGAAQSLCLLVHEKLIEAVAVYQTKVFDAAIQFTRTEGFLPAPETSHAIAVAIEEALRAKEEGKEKVIVFNCSGHGYFDLGAYDRYFAGELMDYDFPEEKLQEALAKLPKV
ncbi:MAG TPA: TrpB-like pyridoxal phosphate-dependent enzyme [bacterium]|nr:TrpB-like pyridoxal phosphate-dependent enzyme [bacterium]HQL63675.1 TrpB-like pyridoxal phosphate-dependent enzyme [bacterium]